jgi:hypothetical protein
MKAYRGSRGITPLILNLDTRFRSVVKVTPWPLFSWEKSNMRLHGSQSQSRHLGEEKNFSPLPGFEPHTVQPVT